METKYYFIFGKEDVLINSVISDFVTHNKMNKSYNQFQQSEKIYEFQQIPNNKEIDENVKSYLKENQYKINRTDENNCCWKIIVGNVEQNEVSLQKFIDQVYDESDISVDVFLPKNITVDKLSSKKNFKLSIHHLDVHSKCMNYEDIKKIDIKDEKWYCIAWALFEYFEDSDVDEEMGKKYLKLKGITGKSVESEDIYEKYGKLVNEISTSSINNVFELEKKLKLYYEKPRQNISIMCNIASRVLLNSLDFEVKGFEYKLLDALPPIAPFQNPDEMIQVDLGKMTLTIPQKIIKPEVPDFIAPLTRGELNFVENASVNDLEELDELQRRLSGLPSTKGKYQLSEEQQAEKKAKKRQSGASFKIETPPKPTRRPSNNTNPQLKELQYAKRKAKRFSQRQKK